MNVTVTGNFVEIKSTPDGQGNLSALSMTLEQYAKHARDANFDATAKAAAVPADRVKLAAAIQADALAAEQK